MDKRQVKKDIEKILADYKGDYPVFKKLDDSIDFLRVYVLYIAYDNECLRREKAQLQSMLNDSN